jgi:hypothetical protein
MDDVTAGSRRTGTRQEPTPAGPQTAKDVERAIRERLYGQASGSVQVKRSRRLGG